MTCPCCDNNKSANGNARGHWQGVKTRSALRKSVAASLHSHHTHHTTVYYAYAGGASDGSIAPLSTATSMCVVTLCADGQNLSACSVGWGLETYKSPRVRDEADADLEIVHPFHLAQVNAG